MKIAHSFISKEKLMKKIAHRNQARIADYTTVSTAFKPEDLKIINDNLDSIARYAERKNLKINRRRSIMNSKPIVPIFYACDDNFVKYTVVSLHSMMVNASKNYHYIVYVLNTNISEKMQQVMLDMQNENFTVQFTDVTDYLKSIRDKLPLRDYYSKTTYYRLFIAEMFPEYDKIRSWRVTYPNFTRNNLETAMLGQPMSRQWYRRIAMAPMWKRC